MWRAAGENTKRTKQGLCSPSVATRNAVQPHEALCCHKMAILHLTWVQRKNQWKTSNRPPQWQRSQTVSSFSFRSSDFHLRPFNLTRESSCSFGLQIQIFSPQTIQLAVPSKQLRLCAKCVKVTQLTGHSRSFQSHGNKLPTPLTERNEILYLWRLWKWVGGN